MSIREVLLSSPIHEKITWAEYSCQEFRGQLLRDKTIVDLLCKLKRAIDASHKKMSEAGIADICRKCEQNEGGSCCGAGVENRYDGRLLLINLLLETRSPEKPHDSESCFFLGKTGCLLQARHVICVNYLCKKITDLIDPQKIIALREKEGEELNILFLLHERIKRILRELNG